MLKPVLHKPKKLTAEELSTLQNRLDAINPAGFSLLQSRRILAHIAALEHGIVDLQDALDPIETPLEAALAYKLQKAEAKSQQRKEAVRRLLDHEDGPQLPDWLTLAPED